MKQGHYTEKELIDIFVSPLSEEIYEIANINHIVHFIYKDEDYYVMLRSVSYAGNPHPLHRFRAQLPRRSYLEAYKHNGGVFLFIGYVAEHNVYVLWNPYPLRPRLNEKDTVSLFCELDSIIKAKNEGLVWSKLPNGGLYVTFTPENLSSVLESLSYFKTEVPLPKHTNDIHSESQLSKFIVNLSSKDLSRLEMVELCMEKYGSTHPEWSFLDWRKCITKVLYAAGE